ncbi:hypothetical protein HOB87_09325 [Candidatus Woesearchaeota archaeon]|nr:hypothetical protein [Candidatus Woesearchaeota archaeon]
MSVVVSFLLIILFSSFVASYQLNVGKGDIEFQTSTETASGHKNLDSLETAARLKAKERAKLDAREICDAQGEKIKYPKSPKTKYTCPGPNIMDLDGYYLQVLCTATIPYICK